MTSKYAEAITMSNFSSSDGVETETIQERTKFLMEFFKKIYLEDKSADFISDAITNMLVCNSVYSKIFEGYIIVSNKRNMPQEMTDGFVKWATEQLDELKIKLNDIYEKNDMR
jgi:hypothetical protein